MAAQVNQARLNELSACVHQALRAFWGYAGLDSFNLPEADANVALAREVSARIDEVGVANAQVKLVVRTHGAQRGEGCASL